MAQAKRKKKFFDVEIPIINKSTQMRAYELQELNGGFLKYDLTRMLKGKSVMMTFNVKVEGEGAIATPKKSIVMPYFIRRMVRKGTNYVEDSFQAECKDAKLIIKPFLVTRRKVSRAVRKALRNKAKEELLSYVKEKNAESLFDEMLRNQMQKFLSSKIEKNLSSIFV
jgi:ribosomal protein S3AE